MKVYQEITLLSAPEIGQHFLWEKVFQQVHLALVEIQDTNQQVPVGLSLPEYGSDNERKLYKLGNKLRLFAAEESILENLNIKKWLQRLSDYVHVTNTRVVPESRISNYARFKRQQAKSNSDLRRLTRRKAQHEKISLEEAQAYYESYQRELLTLPYIQLKSLSSAQKFRLFIAQENVEQSADGSFTTYGLSTGQATVPVF